MAEASQSGRRAYTGGRHATPRASAENLCRDTGPRRRLLEEVRPTATCCENRLVGRTSRASAENLCRDTGPRRRLLAEVRPTATWRENRLVGRTSRGGPANAPGAARP